ncbi:MAG: Serine/threonine-protein kinase [Chaenotheca gracillima]|nr:MAG: Serine/threonine-protein kinase [Chaenotheca gracillima]
MSASKDDPDLSPMPPADEPAESTRLDETKSSDTADQHPSNTSIIKKPYIRPSRPTSNSPRPSRDSSPALSPVRGPLPSRGSRSPKSSQDPSPARPPNTGAGHASGAGAVSSAAVQRALANSNRPSLQPTVVSSQPNRSSRAQSPGGAASAGNATPTSTTNAKSPAPVNTVKANRKVDSETPTPSIVVQSSSPKTPVTHKPPASSGPEDPSHAVGMRGHAGRGAGGLSSKLETVQESSLPATPAIGTGRTVRAEPSSDDERPEKITENPMEEAFAKGTKSMAESGSDSGGAKQESQSRRNSATGPPKSVAPAKSYSTLKGKTPSDVSTQSMTVETETVSSIPQVAVGGGPAERIGAGRSEAGGSLRLKPSTETIRPKKERKKASRKAPSLKSGTASSKADIFEAKINTAVDEANSSDSEETFVYESNPPEPHASRASRYHSRTPSATSTRSQNDHRGGRSNLLDGHHSIAGKRSMKFANTPYNAAFEGDSGAGGEMSTVSRSSARGGQSSHHHHIGHWGRSGRVSHPDSESPYPSGKFVRSGNNSRQSSRPTSPRTPHHLRPGGVHGKKLGHIASWEIDVDGADDERTPLVGPLSARSRHTRPGTSGSLRQRPFDHYRQRSWMGRFFGCLITMVIVILVVASTMGFLFATTKPLIGVHVDEIQNVLASEQEIMLDLVVQAVNPNAISVTVADMDVNVFAKSKYVGTERLWRDDGRRRRFVSTSGVDEGNDPIPDPEGDSQTMLLGRIFEFDSALTFDGSFIQRRASSSVGEVRLAQPGNKTEAGGSARWERVLEHPFELIVRGILQYQLPLSSRPRTASIGASVIVHPENGVDPGGNMDTDRGSRQPYPPGSNMPVRKPLPKPKSFTSP